MDPALVIITNHFPFGPGEAFIEPELKIIQSRFSRILIICRNIESRELRYSAYEFVRINPESSIGDYLKLPFLLLRNFAKVIRSLKDEIAFLKRKDQLNLSRLKIMLHDLSKALVTASALESILNKHQVNERVVLYSYWFNSSALSLNFIRNRFKGLKKISRAHGGDVYEFRQKEKYLSFRNPMASGLDALFFISQDGLSHVRNVLGNQYNQKLILSRLGVLSTLGLQPYVNGKRKLIVSCSFLLPVKRVHLIIDALSLISNHEIMWIHLGGGPLQQELEKLAHQLLSIKHNLQYQFLGNLSTKQIEEFYQNNDVFLFMNTSESEGIPVTIMDAQSRSIPVLALDVGGVKEIVSNKVGRLLPAGSSAIEISKGIEFLLTASQSEINNIRMASYENWKTCYNAEKNFNTFADQILNLFHEVR